MRYTASCQVKKYALSRDATANTFGSSDDGVSFWKILLFDSCYAPLSNKVPSRAYNLMPVINANYLFSLSLSAQESFVVNIFCSVCRYG